MKKTGFGLKIALEVLVFALLGAGFTMLVLGLFLYRDLRQIVPLLGFYVPSMLCFAALLCAAIWFSLKRAAALIDRIDAGEAVSLAERQGARSDFSSLIRIIVIGAIFGFVVLPLAMLVYQALVLKQPPDSTVAGLTLVLSFAFGLSSAQQQIARAEMRLLPQRRKLALTDLGSTKKDMSITVRILVSAIASAFVAAASMGIGGIGMYREYARWVATSAESAASASASDATSGASEASSAAEASADSKSYKAAEAKVLLNLTILALVLLGWGAMATLSTVRFLFAQIGILDERMREIGSGASDLTARATIAFNDEIGRLTADFNGVLEALQALLRSVKGLSNFVTESSRALETSAGDAESSLGFFEKANASVQAAVEAQGGSVASGRSVIARMAESIETVTSHVSTQASYVEENSASIEQMVASISSVSRSAERAGDLAQSLLELTDAGRQVVQDTLRQMGEIQEASVSVGALIGSISKIASQTNLLAMNAAIEAAHAGDSGRGFSVVADEVRSLAETSAKTSREIIELMRAMDVKIKVGSQTTDKAGKAFQDIASGVKDASELVQGIARSMAEQSQGAQEILSSVKSLIEATERIKSLSGDQREQSSLVQAAMTGIAESAAQIEKAIKEQSASTQALSLTIGQIFQEAEKNQSSAESLDSSIGGFRV